MRNSRKKLARAILLFPLFGLIFIVAAWIINYNSAKGKILKVDQAPEKKVAIVFGAGLQWDGRPSPVLRDRINTAVDLYNAGKIQKILMSGDNRFVDYNEPGAMKLYAIEKGIPEAAIVLDFAGRRTYDTCYRAKAIFDLSDVILVTQRYHLPRAIFTCNALGLQAIGVEADRRTYRVSSQIIWGLREIPAQIRAVLDVWLLRPLPVLGESEPIF